MVLFQRGPENILFTERKIITFTQAIKDAPLRETQNFEQISSGCIQGWGGCHGILLSQIKEDYEISEYWKLGESSASVDLNLWLSLPLPSINLGQIY